MEQNIASTGRWGSWHYWNMDKVIEEAFSFDRIIKL
jgi:UDP-galactopyranose mutase